MLRYVQNTKGNREMESSFTLRDKERLSQEGKELCRQTFERGKEEGRERDQSVFQDPGKR